MSARKAGEGTMLDQRPGDARPDCLLGPGTLLLVVGPSGAGKDTLIDIARARFAQEARVLFARRLVTRPAGAGEAHGTLSEAEFEALRAQGRFPLFWRAHGLAYALGPEVAQAIAEGGVVVANGSRATLPEARARFARVRVVHVTAPVAVRAGRLAARGREDAADIEERLSRAPEVDVAPDLVIDNVGTPADGGAQLGAFIAAELAAE
ncbi:phosphonate metabolism protein/1,5-bisphosphokinase (PRPP-forming) PhnN [Xanthobacter autotrophicus]|uniref:phosphonate metabolism protein/1,5-bisphosphokinase (PRPP-forming) PhnN n=1 Tax=Xanthobacter TaxID=279 RepID=UPI0024AA236F|nr:phosphonate metabolism protein/1,5-bisphosphokinase (PRPP-forming) PhnN [Xanthobacter autotrophicus]MDI4667032.1 phosphonate metabolism protein/1,5-bisphosphokinase (PRPP-forming) PhnN [Xanthobacter autotrophicus]